MTEYYKEIKGDMIRFTAKANVSLTLFKMPFILATKHNFDLNMESEMESLQRYLASVWQIEEWR